MKSLARLAAFTGVVVCSGQVIEFESGGLRYQTLTRNGLTIMFAHLPATVREYATLQVAVSNGSSQSVTIKPDEFGWETSGAVMRPIPARRVVNEMLEKGGRSEVVRLVSAYETGIYGMSQLRSTAGYESRRRAALAEVGSTRLKAAAAASAIVFVPLKLAPGESTDGALFFETKSKPMPKGVLRIRAAGSLFEYQVSEGFPDKQ
ncbi:MAG: hypothetical protein FJW30_09365 [Acidobacteria bacterium]|nr:hypothetical protein [Acidobacteriota bacterium]